MLGVHQACALIDREIHQGYRLYTINYIAYDRLSGTDAMAGNYSADDVKAFDDYVERQLGRVNVPGGLVGDEKDYAREMLLTMYANPVRNQLAARC